MVCCYGEVDSGDEISTGVDDECSNVVVPPLDIISLHVVASSRRNATKTPLPRHMSPSSPDTIVIPNIVPITIQTILKNFGTLFSVMSSGKPNGAPCVSNMDGLQCSTADTESGNGTGVGEKATKIWFGSSSSEKLNDDSSPVPNIDGLLYSVVTETGSGGQGVGNDEDAAEIWFTATIVMVMIATVAAKNGRHIMILFMFFRSDE
jgi:hypothetical protein